MSENRPYMKDDGATSVVLPTLGLAAMGGLGFALWHNPEETTDWLTSVWDKVAPSRIVKPKDQIGMAAQARYEQMHIAQDIANKVNPVLRAQQAADIVEKKKKYSLSGLEFSADEYTALSNASWRHTRTLKHGPQGIVDASGNPVMDKIFDNLNRLGLRADRSSAKTVGTTLHFSGEVSGQTGDFVFDLPVFDTHLGVYASHRNAKTAFSSPMGIVSHMQEKGQGFTNFNIEDPVAYFTRSIGDLGAVTYHLNDGNMKRGEVLRDFWGDNKKNFQGDITTYNYETKLEEWLKSKNIKNFKTVPQSPKEFQDLFNIMTSDPEAWKAANNLGGLQLHGQVVKTNPISQIMSGEGGLPEMLGAKKVAGIEGVKGNRGDLVGRIMPEFKDRGNLIKQAIQDGSIRVNNMSLDDLEKINPQYAQIIREGAFQWNLNQDKTAKGTMGLTESMNPLTQVEDRKGLMQQLRWARRGGLGRKSLVQPLIQNDRVFHSAEYGWGGADAMVFRPTTLVGALANDQYLLNRNLTKNLLAESSKEFTFDLMAHEFKDKHGNMQPVTGEVHYASGGSERLTYRDIMTKAKDNNWMNNLDRVEYDPNTVFGFKSAAGFGRTQGDIDAMADGITGSFQSSSSRIVQYADDIKRSFDMTMETYDSGEKVIKLVGWMQDNASKISNRYSKFRNNTEMMDETLDNLLQNFNKFTNKHGSSKVQGITGGTFVKKVFTKMGESGTWYSDKNVTEIPQTLMGFATGAINTMGRPVASRAALEELQMGRQFMKNLPNADFIDLKQWINGGGQFDLKPLGATPEESIKFAQRFTGTMYQQRIGAVLNGTKTFAVTQFADLEQSGKTIDTLLNANLGDKAADHQKMFQTIQDAINPNLTEMQRRQAEASLLYDAPDIIPNEQPGAVLGEGSNIARVGVRELHMLDPETARSIAVRNIVNSEAIMREGETMMLSMADGVDLAHSLPSHYKPAHLQTAQDISEFTGGYSDTANFVAEMRSNTKAFFGSLGSENNKHGFTLPYEMNEAGDLGIFYGMGKEGLGGVTYLPDEEKVALDRTIALHGEMLKSATADADGKVAVPYAKAQQIMEQLGDINGRGSKTGFIARGALQIAGADYSYNKAGDAFLNNPSILKAIEKNELAANTLGNIAYVSPEAFKGQYQQEIQKSVDLAGTFNNDKLGYLENAYGKESDIYKKTLSYQQLNGEISSHRISSQWADEAEAVRIEMEKVTRRFEKGNATEAELEAVMRKTRSGAGVFVAGRDPHINVKSMSDALVLPHSDFIGKSVALGGILKTVFNADHDGDKITMIANMYKTQRIAALSRIDTTVQHVKTIMEHLKDNIEVQHLKDEAKYRSAYSDVEIGKIAALAEETKWHTAVASYMTKALTGTSDVAARGIQSQIKLKMMGKNLTNEEMQSAENFYGSFVPLEFIQNPISSKKMVMSQMGADNKVVSALGKMFNSMREMSQEDFNEHIVKSEGIDPLSLLGMSEARKSGQVPWVKQSEEHFNNLFAAQHNLRRVEPEAYRSTLEHYGFQDIDSRMAAHEKRLVSTDFKDLPLYEKAHIPVAAQLEGTDFLDAAASGHRDLPNLNSTYQKIKSQNKKMSDDQVWRKTFAKVFKTDLGAYMSENMQSFTGNTGQHSARAMRGWDAITEATKWVGKSGTRLAAVGLMGMAGLMAVNAIMGDGAPENYHDVPSVNNPSFAEGKYAPQVDNRMYSNGMHGNMETSLLTDSLTPSESVVNHLSSAFGSHYSTVNFNDSRRDPYADATFKYNM
jgi:hypothetical protein